MTGQATDARRPWLRRPLFWVTISYLLVVLAITLVVVMYNRAAHSNEAQRARQREAITSFVAPSGWEEYEGYPRERSDHPCLILSLCKQYHVTWWSATERPSGTSLMAVAEASGWTEVEFSTNLAERVACLQEFGSVPWCPSLAATVKAVSGRVSLRLSADQQINSEYWVIILRAD